MSQDDLTAFAIKAVFVNFLCILKPLYNEIKKKKTGTVSLRPFQFSESGRGGSLTQARGHLWAWRYGFGCGRCVVGLRSAAGKQLIGRGQEVSKGAVGPGGVVKVVVVGTSGVGT